jgi:Fic family protein
MQEEEEEEEGVAVLADAAETALPDTPVRPRSAMRAHSRRPHTPHAPPAATAVQQETVERKMAKFRQEMLEAVRAKSGRYSAEMEQMLRAQGGSQIYMMLFATKARQAKGKARVTAYEALPRWDPANRPHLLEAPGLLMAGLIDAPGRFRNGGVGIYRGDQLVHMAPPAARVPALVGELLAWLASSHWHPLIVNCVAHYELEFIHPFADGNGRLGRLWQTLILSRWNPLLAWLPIEEVIRSRQQGYYDSLGQADQQGDLAPFVAYQLEAIHDALRSEIGSEKGSEIKAEPLSAIDLAILRDLTVESNLSARRLAERLQLSPRAVEKHLAALQKAGRLLRQGSPRAGFWQVL